MRILCPVRYHLHRSYGPILPKLINYYLNNKSVQQEAELEDLNRKIKNLKGDIKTCNDQVEILEEENKNKEVELERAKEEIKSIYSPFFDLYHTKTVFNILNSIKFFK